MDILISIQEHIPEYRLYKCTMKNWRGQEYESHLTKEGYRLLLIKTKLHFQLRIPNEDIDEFENAVREDQIEQDSWND